MRPVPAYWAIVPAAGRGLRLGGAVPKQHLELGGKTLLRHSLDVLLRHPNVHGAVLALAPGDPHWPTVNEIHGKQVIEVIGGDERHESVLSALHGLTPCADADDWVLVHDAARPCLSDSDLDKLMGALHEDPVGGILAAPARDTLKRVEGDRIKATVARATLWHAMTPQMFRYQLLFDCLRAAIAEGAAITDEASALERAGYEPRLVEGSWENFKVTRAEDLSLAELILGRPRP